MNVLAERARLCIVVLAVVATMAVLLVVSGEPAKAYFSCSHRTALQGGQWHWHWYGQWHTTYYKSGWWSDGNHYHRATLMVEVPYGFENSWVDTLDC